MICTTSSERILIDEDLYRCRMDNGKDTTAAIWTDTAVCISGKHGSSSSQSVVVTG